MLTVLFSKIGSISDVSYFKGVAIKSLRLAPFLPFAISFFTFSLLVELPLTLLVLFFAAISAMIDVEKKPEHAAAKIFCTVVLYCVSIAYIIYAIFSILNNSNDFFQIRTIKEFTLSPLMTLLILPVIYCVALSVNYIDSFRALNYTVKDKKRLHQLKKEVFLCSGGSIARAFRIRKGISFFEEPSLEKIRSLSNSPSKLNKEMAQFAPMIAIGQTLDQLILVGAMTKMDPVFQNTTLGRNEPNKKSWSLSGVYRWGIEGSALIYTAESDNITSLVWTSDVQIESIEDLRRQTSVDLNTFSELKERLDLLYGLGKEDDLSDQNNVEFAWLNNDIKRTLGLTIDDLNKLNTLTYCEIYWNRPSLELD